MVSQRKKVKTKNDTTSELRQDIVTGEWVVIATGRAKRSGAYIKQNKQEFSMSIEDCPFENPQKSGNEPPLLFYKNKKYPGWSLQVITNKYPALTHKDSCGGIKQKGEYFIREGRGYHEVIITRNHKNHIALLSNAEVTQVLQSYHSRYVILKEDGCVKYVSIFHNHGKTAGASLPHPHSQLIATPVIPVTIQRSLEGSNTYYRRNRQCVHCVVIGWELKEKKRIIFENEDFVAFCPFVSRRAFEVRIFPKKHDAYFENSTQKQLPKLAEVLRASLKSLYDVLENPDYNFFIHTAPVDKKRYPNYHWHIEIIPQTEIWAGFEISTGIEISTIEPKKAAQYLRKAIK